MDDWTAEEKDLYELVTKANFYNRYYIEEYGWVDDKFIIWIRYSWLETVRDILFDIFGKGRFEENGVVAVLKEDNVCIDLTEMLEGSVDLEEVFPKDRFSK